MLNAKPTAVADAGRLDQAFEALKTFDWGSDPKVLRPIEEAVVASLGNAEARTAIEKRLAAVLETDVPYAAKDFVCRKLRLAGGEACIPVLARLLTDEKLSHMARYALERIPHPAAGGALRDALPKTKGKLAAGIAGSLGARRDTAAVPALKRLLSGGDPEVVIAAATALGSIATPESAEALAAAVKTAPKAALAQVIDAGLRAAEALAAQGKTKAAEVVFVALESDGMPEHVRFAAKRDRARR